MTTQNTLRTKVRSALLGLALVGAASLMTGTEALADKDQCLRDGGTPAAEVKVGECRPLCFGNTCQNFQSVKVRYLSKNWLFGGWHKSRWMPEISQPCSNKGNYGEHTPTGEDYGKGPLKGDLCVHKIGRQITWHDGASAPWLASYYSLDPKAYYTKIFRRAGIQHDHCYHHGKATYGYSKKYCDDEMLRKMREECSFRWPGNGSRNRLKRNV